MKNIMYRFILLFLITLFLTSLAWPSTTGKIAGIIIDRSTGDPLPGANVFVQGTTLGTATDMDGQYIILQVPPGTYNIVIDYNTKEIVIMISYLEKLVDESTGMFDVISQKKQRIYHFSLEENAFVKVINIPDPRKRQEWIGSNDAVMPSYEFIGVTVHGYYFLIRPEDQNQQCFGLQDR